MPSIISPHRGGKTKMTTGTGASTVLGAGELFVEYPDTGAGSGKSKIKIGDGVTAYSSLPYALGDTSTDLIVFDSSTATTVAQALAEAVSGASLATIVAGLKKAIELNTSVKVFTGSLADWEQLTDAQKLEYDLISNDEPGGLQEMFPSSRVGYSTNSNVESELNKLNGYTVDLGTISGSNFNDFFKNACVAFLQLNPVISRVCNVTVTYSDVNYYYGTFTNVDNYTVLVNLTVAGGATMWSGYHKTTTNKTVIYQYNPVTT